jgi:hypothetical protein
VLESLWLGELNGPAKEIRDLLKSKIDNDDGLAVIELARIFDWATVGAQKHGNDWLAAKSP